MAGLQQLMQHGKYLLLRLTSVMCQQRQGESSGVVQCKPLGVAGDVEVAEANTVLP